MHSWSISILAHPFRSILDLRMYTEVLLIVGPPFSYDTRLRMRSVNVAGHYSLLARHFDNHRFLMPQ